MKMSLIPKIMRKKKTANRTDCRAEGKKANCHGISIDIVSKYLLLMLKVKKKTLTEGEGKRKCQTISMLMQLDNKKN